MRRRVPGGRPQTPLTKYEIIGAYTLEQPDAVPRLGADTLALSAFVTLRPRDRVCDFGCGGGALPLLLLSRQPGLDVTAIDREPPCVAAARGNAARNGLDFSVALCDWRDMPRPEKPFDVAVSNPPYHRPGHGAIPSDGARARARVWDGDGLDGLDGLSGLDGLCAAAARVTRRGGRFALVYPASELAALFGALTAHGWEPKRLRFAHHGASKNASFVLAEARLGGQPGVTVEGILDLA